MLFPNTINIPVFVISLVYPLLDTVKFQFPIVAVFGIVNDAVNLFDELYVTALAFIVLPPFVSLAVEPDNKFVPFICTLTVVFLLPSDGVIVSIVPVTNGVAIVMFRFDAAAYSGPLFYADTYTFHVPELLGAVNVPAICVALTDVVLGVIVMLSFDAFFNITFV